MSNDDRIPYSTRKSRKVLNPRQIEDYEDHRKACFEWLLDRGKNPDKYDGYGTYTVKNDAYRLDQFFRFVWEEENDGKYTVEVSHEYADDYLRYLAAEEKHGEDDGAKHRQALMRYYKWRAYKRGGEEYDPAIKFDTDNGMNARDYLSREERSAIREAALEYGVVPEYDDLSAADLDEVKAHLAQKYEKPKDEITKDDFDRANGWKIPSLLYVSLDAALRPCEVQRSTVNWLDTENQVIRIPKEESSKNRDNWTLAVSDRTTRVLERWLAEREDDRRYDNTDAIWLTRENNPWSPQSLRYLLHQLCDVAGINTENRQMSWYSIRHSTGTYLTEATDLSTAKEQLRHESLDSTARYAGVNPDKRREALNEL